MRSCVLHVSLCSASDYLMPLNMSYHNVGTLGPAAISTVSAIQATNVWLESNPDGMYFEQADNAIARMEATRAKGAAFLGVALDETVLIESTTFGLNTVSTGLVESQWLGAHDRVVRHANMRRHFFCLVYPLCVFVCVCVRYIAPYCTRSWTNSTATTCLDLFFCDNLPTTLHSS